ncbi:uncharacterized protein LOC130813313 [Amaranthus tricolor]|uniref:uncharacterized protein LOC130813313 n=1 Tax=Amaranthus tricolor TaxID=29722 RepID=UPI002583E8E5|nr:uncharacterized protein LOC130813313 [Amaranthus tricolor]
MAAPRSLARFSPLSNSATKGPANRFMNFRHKSNVSLVFSVEDPAPEEMETIAMKNLEDAIHKIIVKKSQPNWIALVPGASYWVPPKSKAQGIAHVIGKLVNNSTTTNSMLKDKSFLSSNRGWPSSAYFFKGASNSPLEGETISKQTSQSEDEEG